MSLFLKQHPVRQEADIRTEIQVFDPLAINEQLHSHKEIKRHDQMHGLALHHALTACTQEFHAALLQANVEADR